MTILRVERWLMGAALVAATLASGRTARARQEASDKDKKPAAASASGEVSVGTTGASASAEADKGDKGDKADKGEKAEKDEEKEEKAFKVGIDFVIGSAKTDSITQTQVGGATGTSIPTTVANTPRVTAYSFIIGAEWEAAHGFDVGVRVPFEAGTIFAPYQRGAGGFGNVELEAGGEIQLGKDLELELELGVALPTAQGAEFNAANPVVIQGAIDQSASDRFTIQRAVAMSRGYEENALYEPKHLGIIPKVKLEWGEHGKWKIDPWVKLENLIGTSDGLAHNYVGELLLGVNAGYNVTKAFEPGLRVWVNAPLSGADFTTVAIVEPQLRLHLGDVTPLAGVILPFAGPLTNPYAVGVRLGLGAKF